MEQVDKIASINLTKLNDFYAKHNLHSQYRAT